jgi:hypothetical protein
VVVVYEGGVGIPASCDFSSTCYQFESLHGVILPTTDEVESLKSFSDHKTTTSQGHIQPLRCPDPREQLHTILTVHTNQTQNPHSGSTVCSPDCALCVCLSPKKSNPQENPKTPFTPPISSPDPSAFLPLSPTRSSLRQAPSHVRVNGRARSRSHDPTNQPVGVLHDLTSPQQAHLNKHTSTSTRQGSKALPALIQLPHLLSCFRVS